MKISVLLSGLLDSKIGKVLPARVMNPLYRFLIDELGKEGKRDAFPSEIFETPPIICFPSSRFKVATLVSTRDLEMLVWSLKSLFYFSERSWDLVIMDGGLKSSDVSLLQHHFPNARIFLEADLIRELASELNDLQYLSELRLHRGYAPAKKIIDAPRLMRGHKFLLLDSDVLFFRSPSDIIRLLEDEDQRFAFSVDELGINSGVAVVPASGISFAELERLLRSMSPEKLAGWQVEQDLYSLLSKNRFDELPSVYAVEPVRGLKYNELTCCHFVHVCRHRFYSEGIRQLRASGFVGQLRMKYSPTRVADSEERRFGVSKTTGSAEFP